MQERSRLAQTPPCPTHVNPRPLLEELAAELKLPLDEAGIELRLLTETPVLVCERTRLTQLFAHLIGNAMRHRQPGTQSRIDVRVETVSDGWQVAVQDNGPGISPEDAERIFQAFQTAQSPGRPKTGSGLGLAIVKKIVESLGGRVSVENERGKGARFVVWLPRV